jgi:hypothetical protein
MFQDLHLTAPQLVFECPYRWQESAHAAQRRGEGALEEVETEFLFEAASQSGASSPRALAGRTFGRQYDVVAITSAGMSAAC